MTKSLQKWCKNFVPYILGSADEMAEGQKATGQFCLRIYLINCVDTDLQGALLGSMWLNDRFSKLLKDYLEEDSVLAFQYN